MSINENFPLVSVIIPAYNAAAFINRTLDFVLTQTYTNIEVLVVDDGSQDCTVDIVQSYLQQDRRIILLQQANQGVAVARNLAIQKSRGEYIAPLDADDIWYPQKLEKQVQCILNAPSSVGLVYAVSMEIDEEDLIIDKYSIYNRSYQPEGNVYTNLVCSNFIGNASAPLIRRSCFEHIGGYSCQLKEQDAQGCEDWDIYLRIAEFYQFQVVPEVLIGYRQVSGSMGSKCKTMIKSYNLVLHDVQQRHPEIPATIYRWSRSFFYNYLSVKSSASGDYCNALFCLYKALESNLFLLLRLATYRITFMLILKIVIKSIFCLILQDKYTWKQLKEKIKRRRHNITIYDIKNRKINLKYKDFVWKPYDIVLLHRWLKILKISQEVDFQLKAKAY